MVRYAGEFGQRRADDGATEALFRQSCGFVVELQAVDMTKPAEHRKVVSGPAADLQDSRSGRQLRLPADQVGEDPAARAVPPVAVVELGHLLVDDAFHQRNTNCLFSAKVASGVTKTAGMSGHHVGPCIGPVSTQVNTSFSRKPEACTARNLTFRRWSSRAPWPLKLQRLWRTKPMLTETKKATTTASTGVIA